MRASGAAPRALAPRARASSPRRAFDRSLRRDSVARGTAESRTPAAAQRSCPGGPGGARRPSARRRRRSARCCSTWARDGRPPAACCVPLSLASRRAPRHRRSGVPVQVDVGERADIAERYGLGAWPSLLLLTPDGDVLTGGTWAGPGRLLEVLERVHTTWRQRRAELAVEPRPARRRPGHSRRARRARRTRRRPRRSWSGRSNRTTGGRRRRLSCAAPRSDAAGAAPDSAIAPTGATPSSSSSAPSSRWPAVPWSIATTAGCFAPPPGRTGPAPSRSSCSP